MRRALSGLPGRFFLCDLPRDLAEQRRREHSSEIAQVHKSLKLELEALNCAAFMLRTLLYLSFRTSARPRRLRGVAKFLPVALHFPQRIDRLILRFIISAGADLSQQPHRNKLDSAQE